VTRALGRSYAPPMSTEHPDPGTPAPSIVLAAGGVVLDPHPDDPDGARVLVVHRPAYDDWSLPKGHLDVEETPSVAAVREVLEETGVTARIVSEAGITEHIVPTSTGAATKRVHWFVMRAVSDTDPGQRTPDTEVDRAAWWSIASALTGLTYQSERLLLSRAASASVDTP